MKVKVYRVEWEFLTPFRIAYKTRTHASSVIVELSDGLYVGRGEALGVSYHGETAELIVQQIVEVCDRHPQGFNRQQLQHILPAGGARNGIDCALWDLEARREGCRVCELAGLGAMRPLRTAYTLGIDSPEAMATSAVRLTNFSLLKVKLNGENDLEIVTKIRRMRPEADIIVDANQSWGEDQLVELSPKFAGLGVQLIEQPLPVGRDDMLSSFDSPVLLCADESCQTRASLIDVAGKYGGINIKLDKTGGLTEALALAREARALGLQVMVGSMGGSSLAMAPAFVTAQIADYADLDGPLLLHEDIDQGLDYRDDNVCPPSRDLWG